MSFKTGLIKMAIKLTPNVMILWVANLVLKGIAELTDFNFDLDARKVYVQTQLVGEAETIDVWIEDFAILTDDGSYQLIIHKARSNRIWLDNLLGRVAGKTWNIPVIPQLSGHLELISELFKAENTEQWVESDSHNSKADI